MNFILYVAHLAIQSGGLTMHRYMEVFQFYLEQVAVVKIGMRQCSVALITGSLLLITIHSITIQSYGSTEWVVFMIGPCIYHWSSVPVVTWSTFVCSVTSLTFQPLKHPLVLRLSFVTFPASSWQAKSIRKLAGSHKLGSHEAFTQWPMQSLLKDHHTNDRKFHCKLSWSCGVHP